MYTHCLPLRTVVQILWPSQRGAEAAQPASIAACGGTQTPAPSTRNTPESAAIHALHPAQLCKLACSCSTLATLSLIVSPTHPASHNSSTLALLGVPAATKHTPDTPPVSFERPPVTSSDGLPFGIMGVSRSSVSWLKQGEGNSQHQTVPTRLTRHGVATQPLATRPSCGPHRQANIASW
jgi:hypothetical protein